MPGAIGLPSCLQLEGHISPAGQSQSQAESHYVCRVRRVHFTSGAVTEPGRTSLCPQSQKGTFHQRGRHRTRPNLIISVESREYLSPAGHSQNQAESHYVCWVRREHFTSGVATEPGRISLYLQSQACKIHQRGSRRTSPNLVMLYTVH